MDRNIASINGFINLYKHSGPTSMDMVRQIKKVASLKKGVGHGGTLDPLAEGVLPICFGQATRLMVYLVDTERVYRMEVHLGVTTTTYDGEGEVAKRGDASGLSRGDVEEAMKSFKGLIQQTPPMYSALKVGGKRLYKLARAGVEVEREPRQVEISKIDILDYTPPSLLLQVGSGRGAYMRSLGHDLGEALGCGGYLKSLVRLKAGPFSAEEAVPMSTLQEGDGGDGLRSHVLPPDYVLLHLKSMSVSKAAERFLRIGQSVSVSPEIGAYAGYMERYRAYTEDGRFLALVSFDKTTNQWRPYKVFNMDIPSPYAPSP